MQITIKECAEIVGLTKAAIHQQYHRGTSYGSLFEKVDGVLLAEKTDIEYMLEQRGPRVQRDYYIKVPVSKDEKAMLEKLKGSKHMTEYLRSRFLEAL